jgi:hypothetical protein
MFVVLQFPLTDLRPFIDGETHRLPRPSWPLARPGREYVRGSGGVQQRRRGGVEGWSGEEVFSGAARAVRFPDALRRHPIGGDFRATCLFRRYFSDGVAARVELGLRLEDPSRNPPQTLSSNDTLRVLRDCLRLDLRVPQPDGRYVEHHALAAGDRLADHYLRSTTRRIDGNAPAHEAWWLSAGEPLLIVESRLGRFSLPDSLPPHSRRCQPLEGSDLELAHCRVEEEGRPVGVWILVPGRRTDPDTLRRIRVHLGRLHVERQALESVLASLGSRLKITPGTSSSDRIQEFLSKSVSLLERSSRFGFEQQKLLQAAKHWTHATRPGHSATLDAELARARRNVELKVQRFTRTLEGAQVVNFFGDDASVRMRIQKAENLTMKKIHFGGDVSVTGDFNAVTADTIQNSFNKATGSDAAPELKAKLEELAEQVATMAKALPEDAAEQAARDLEVLTQEATSKKPREAWYKLSAEGLVEAAKTVGEVAKPIISTVTAILALL